MGPVTRLRCALLLAVLFAGFPGTTSTASETLTHQYDSRGRLVRVVRTGTVNNGVNTCYTNDRADNRTKLETVVPGACTAPSVPTFSIGDATVTEGGTLVFTVTKTGSAGSTLTIGFATTDAGTIAGRDYAAHTGTLTFLAADASKTVSVAATDDTLAEPSENLLVNLSNSSVGAAITDGQGLGTIQDNDSDCIGVSFGVASDGAVTEGVNSAFTVTKTGTSSFSCSVDYATADVGTYPYAIATADYTATSGALIFASNETSKTINVTTINDTTKEPGTETFSMRLTGANKGGVVGSPATAIAAIKDNDGCSGLAFTITNNAAVNEGLGSVFTITRGGTASGSCSVDYVSANGTAGAPGDYGAASGTMVFTSTQTSQTLTVPTVDDSSVESSETFTVSLSNPTHGSVLGTPNSATATIIDTDGGGACSSVSFNVNDASVTEGGALVFTVSKSGSTSSSCNVSYATADGTATAPGYYTLTTGTLTFTAAQTSKTVSIATVDRGRLNGIRTMYLNLTSTTNGGVIADSQGVGSISASGGGGGCPTCLLGSMAARAQPGLNGTSGLQGARP